MGAGRAGGADHFGGAPPAEAHGDARRPGVGHHHRDQERAHPVHAFCRKHPVLFTESVEAADASPDQGAVVDPRSLLELFPAEDVTGGLDAPVRDDATVVLLPAMAGGDGR